VEVHGDIHPWVVFLDTLKVKVEFKDVETGMLIWAKTFEWTDVDEEIPKSLAGYAGLGEAEVNDLVQRKFSEMERSRELERLTSELQRVSALNEELEFQVQDFEKYGASNCDPEHKRTRASNSGFSQS
jgi:hypothetical protein